MNRCQNDRTLLVDEICKKLKELSEKDLRIGQIFTILFSNEDLFYVENDVLLKKLLEFK